MHVQLLMHTHLQACHPESTLARAAQLMWNADVGAIPVVDSERRLLGIITDRDICMAAYTKGLRLSEVTVGSVMSREPKTCEPSDSIALAMERMREHQVRRLPVTQDGYLLGMLSLSELAMAASHAPHHKFGKHDGIAPDDVAQTLAAVSEHRRSVAAQ